MKVKLLKKVRKRYHIEYKEGDFTYRMVGDSNIYFYNKKLILTDTDSYNNEDADYTREVEFRILNDDFDLQLDNAKKLMLHWIRDAYSYSVSREKKQRRLVHNTKVWYNPNLLLKK